MISNMLLFKIFGLLVSVVAFGTLVVGDAGTVVTLKSAKVTNNANEYFDPWEIEIIETKKSSKVTAKMPTKKQLPDTMQVKFTAIINDEDPIEYESSFCEGLSEETIGKSIVEAGTPKGEFPKECPPFGAGDWVVLKWDPPTDKIPPGVPDGPVHGTILIMEEGKEPYVQIDYEGELSHPPPGMGR